jgi:hypothetical protein
MLGRDFRGKPPLCRWALVLSLLSVLPGLVSCTNLPGTTYGTYGVTGTLGSNTCGPGIAAPDPWEFSVLLSKAGATLYWSWMDGSPLLSGPVNVSGSATLTAYEIDNVDTRDGGVQGPCDLQRNDQINLTLAEGTPPASFEGTVSYTFSVQVGANCKDQLAPSGGMYSQLPCGVSYALSGAHQ